nr:hypothetical protein Iba_chr04cCG14480 [Ipomoea batatas]
MERKVAVVGRTEERKLVAVAAGCCSAGTPPPSRWFIDHPSRATARSRRTERESEERLTESRSCRRSSITAVHFSSSCSPTLNREGSLLRGRERSPSSLYCIGVRRPPSSSAASITTAPLLSPSSLATAGKTKDEERWSCLADATRHPELAGKRRRRKNVALAERDERRREGATDPSSFGC